MPLPFYPITKQMQTHSTRKTPKKANRGAFSCKVRKTIIERDNGLCVRCGARYEEIHHVIFRSAGGLGTVDNGVCVCHACHELAHSKKLIRKWFERYRLQRLIETKT